MGINVRVESENRVLISELVDSAGLTAGLIPPDSDASSSCLRFVDPYGDTVFNQLQIPVLLGELRRQTGEVDAPTAEHGLAIIQLVETASGRVHTYVRFVGD